MGHHGGADDGCLFGFYEGDGFILVLGQEVFSEEALGELPVFGQEFLSLECGVDPVDSAWHVRVFCAVAGVGVVLHDLSCAALVVLVYLQEDDCLVWG